MSWWIAKRLLSGMKIFKEVVLPPMAAVNENDLEKQEKRIKASALVRPCIMNGI
jgi:hypothetical protein